MVLPHVEVAVAVELDDPARGGGHVRRELLAVDRAGRRDEQRPPAVVGETLAEVGLVGVDEELRVEVADLPGGLAADERGTRLDPVDWTGATLDDKPAVEEERLRGGRSD